MRFIEKLRPILKTITAKVKARPVTQREKKIFYTTLIIIAVAGIINFIFMPLYSLVEKFSNEVDQKTYLYQRYSGLIKRGGDIASLYEKYKTLLSRQQTPEEGITALFEEIKKAARECNVNIEKVKPLTVEQSSLYKQTALDIDVFGDFISLFRFIAQLEYSPLVIKIKALQFASYPGSPGMLQCRAKFSKIFF